MKNKLVKSWLLLAALVLIQGCVAFPPLIQVERKDGNPQPAPPNPELMRRLDSIDHRLDQLERKVDSPVRQGPPQ